LLANHHQELLDGYNNCLYKKGQLVNLKKDNIKFSCIIQSVNSFGELIVENGLKTISNLAKFNG